MKKILLTTIAVAAFAQGASALEAGKMYMRADLGYNFSSPKLGDKVANGTDTDSIFKATKKSNKLKGFSGDIGFGYALSDSIRTDVTLNMSKGSKKLKDVELGTLVTNDKFGSIETLKVVSTTDMTITGGTVALKNSVSLKEKKLGLMANAYYDFNNASEFTPYVMAGVGVSRGSLEAKISGYETGTAGNAVKTASETIKSKNSTSIAYQVGVGVGYEMSKDIFLDVGYKMSGTSGSYKFKKADLAAADTTVTPATTAGILNGIVTDKDKFGSPKLQHTLTAGVRFAF